MRHNGFLLMEFMVYLVLFSMTMLIITSLVGKIWIPTMHHTQIQTARIDLATAYDCFVEDIKIAKAEKKFWKLIQPTGIIFKSGWRDVGWLIEHNNLIRVSGTYNEKSKSWDKKTKSLIVKGIEKVQFDVVGTQEVRYVKCQFGQMDQEIISEISLVNGTIPWQIKP